MVRFMRIGFALLAFFYFSQVKATHIVGGELNYRYLGNNQYEITLTIYRDCWYGEPPFDNPASLGIFYQNNNLYTQILMPFPGLDTLEHAINNPCFTAPVNICYEVTTYIDTVVLPPTPGGYQLAYQRCCRNNSILNLVSPGFTGATYYATIPSSSITTVNSNPRFQNLPPTFICANAPFIFDHSAFDPDGDSLVYEICYPWQGANQFNPMPQPPNNPPYQNVQFISPYNLNNQLGGPQPLTINPQTGLLTAIPGINGQFVYGVCVKEYRNGVYLSTTRRDFQVNVIACPNVIIASFNAPDVQCGNNTVQFTNNSFNGNSFLWDFGTGNPADTSNDVNPVFTFPDTGLYNVTLVAISSFSSECNDTITKTIRLYPEYNAEFSFEIPLCDYNVSFTDTATLLSGPPTAWNWNFGDGTTSAQNDPVHTFPGPGNYNVTLISTSAGGCRDTIIHLVELDTVLTVTANSSNVLCFGDCNGSASVTAFGGELPHQFIWSPGNEITPGINNLCAGNYSVSVTDAQGCIQFRNFTITQPDLLVGSDFTTDAYCHGNCIGTTIITPSGGTPVYSIEWNDPDSSNSFYINELCEGVYTYVITDINGCTFTDSVEVVYSDYLPPVNATVDEDTIYLGATTFVHATNNFGYTHNWFPPESLTSPFAATSVAGPEETITYFVQIADSNGCINIDSVTIWVRVAICDDPEIFIPNAFTPDNDGVNDVLFVRGNSINKLFFTIYDRWGQQVFTTEDLKLGWDGTFKGKEAGAGVYVYYAEGTCYGGFTFFKKGNITLMR